MSSTKVLWGQICAALGIVLVTMWAATQWVAWKLGFQPQLGPPWFELVGGMPVYYPPAFFWWWLVYDAYAPRDIHAGRLHRSVGRHSLYGRRVRDVDLAGARGEDGRDLRLGALGYSI